jgi:hypothetical protein
MADVYFHFSNTRGVLIDRSGTAVDDLDDAREHAVCAVRSYHDGERGRLAWLDLARHR